MAKLRFVLRFVDCGSYSRRVQMIYGCMEIVATAGIYLDVERNWYLSFRELMVSPSTSPCLVAVRGARFDIYSIDALASMVFSICFSRCRRLRFTYCTASPSSPRAIWPRYPMSFGSSMMCFMSPPVELDVRFGFLRWRGV